MLAFLSIKKGKKKSTDTDTTTSNPVARTNNFRRLGTCAGAYNSFVGPKKQAVSLYAKYIVPPPGQRWIVSTYVGLPSIASRECTNKVILCSKDKGLVCQQCNVLHNACGKSNPGVILNHWKKDIQRCFDRRKRQVITACNHADAVVFTKKTCSNFIPESVELMEEAKALIDYYNCMLSTCLCKGTVYSVSDGEVPGVKTIFEDVAKLYEENPECWDSVIVSLLKGAAVKSKFGSNAATEKRCVNFFCYIQSISKTVYSALRINLDGPSSCWTEKLNACEGVPCIVDSGKRVHLWLEGWKMQLKDVVQTSRMGAET
eukprot:5015512-Ditylum_brightwellii.AAC.1